MNLEMLGINKAFGTNLVLKDVHFSLKGGEICALIGENGAGKSTLMNILGGVLPADSGEMLLDGNPVVFTHPSRVARCRHCIYPSRTQPDQRPG